MTTTIELIERQLAVAESRIGEGKELFLETAQRLRELDKPDCGWQYVGGNTNYIMGCNKRANGVWSLYCPNCGGAVKDAT
jgi:hypothetical protein